MRVMWAVLWLTAGCAGRTTFDSCTPNVCACDFETCEDLLLAPGETGTVLATFVAEGSHKGPYSFTSSSTGSGSVLVDPESADMDGETPLELRLTVIIDADAEVGTDVSVSFEGAHDNSDLAAGDSFRVEVR